MSSLVALLDIGKTNSKVSLIDSSSCLEVWSARCANRSVQTPHGRELDVAHIERWLVQTLRNAPVRGRIESIVPVAHGAAAASIDRNGHVLAAPDYEDECFESLSELYDRERDPFAETFSPNLPLGLNLGRQLFYLQHARPEVWSRAAHILLYPQYWAWRLCGVAASEVTSLGCHTDLWRPQSRSYSALAERCGFTALMPPLRAARDRLGRITPEIAQTCDLDPGCQVLCGIHDSNASYLQFLIGREQSSFAVVSSGTWTIVMANRGDLSRLEEARDMLANVDAFAAPVATARFMGGREYEAIAREGALPTLAALERVIELRAMALPSFASAGPFSGRAGRLLRDESLTASERAALASVYLALMTELLLESLGASGEVLIDGPLAQNPVFGLLLAALLPGSAVKCTSSQTGAKSAALYLAGSDVAMEDSPAIEPMRIAGLDDYRSAWRAELSKQSTSAAP